MNLEKEYPVIDYIYASGTQYEIPWSWAVHSLKFNGYTQKKVRLELVSSWVNLETENPEFGSNNIMYKFAVKDLS